MRKGCPSAETEGGKRDFQSGVGVGQGQHPKAPQKPGGWYLEQVDTGALEMGIQASGEPKTGEFRKFCT